VDDPTECKLAYFGVVSHPAGEAVAHLIDKFLQRSFAQRLWFACLVSRLHFGYVVATLPGSVPPHPFRGGDRLWVLRVTSLAHVRNVVTRRARRAAATRVRCSASRSRTSLSGSGNRPSKASRTSRWMVPWPGGAPSRQGPGSCLDSRAGTALHGHPD
jgi:hypothetical protein